MKIGRWYPNEHTTIVSRYLAVIYNTIIHPEQQLQWYNFDQTLHSRMTPDISPSRASYAVSFVNYSKKYDRDYRERIVFGFPWQQPVACMWSPETSDIMIDTITSRICCTLRYEIIYVKYVTSCVFSLFCLWCCQIFFDSFRPSGTYMRKWTRPSLKQIMVCRLFGAKLWHIVNWTLGNKFQWNSNH